MQGSGIIYQLVRKDITDFQVCLPQKTVELYTYNLYKLCSCEEYRMTDSNNSNNKHSMSTLLNAGISTVLSGFHTVRMTKINIPKP